MRRADRLFQIIQILRSRRTATTARYLADELQVTQRTIYRDVQDLTLSGVPIIGEAGVGYALPPNFDLPPLMFREDELTAITLGARLVESWADKELADAAKLALQKIQAVIPERLGHRLARETLFSPLRQIDPRVATCMAQLRLATEGRQKIHFEYTSLDESHSHRTVWPLGMFFWGSVWTLGSWCELRQDFRSFRVDRIHQLTLLDVNYPQQSGRTLDDFIENACKDR